MRAATAWMLACSVGVLGCSASAQSQVAAPSKAAAPPDADGDGIADASDRCAGGREDGRAPEPADGCPAPPPEAKVTVSKMPKVNVEVTRTEVKINEKIQFGFRKTSIDPASDGLVKEIADVLKAHPEVELVEVAGHADNVGAATINLRLTSERARAVVTALTNLGIEKSRLRAVGYGSYCPIDSGDGEAAREANRRVELKIVKVSGKETGVELGCPAAAAKGVGGAAERSTR